MDHKTMRQRVLQARVTAKPNESVWAEIRAPADGEDTTVIRIYDAIDSWGGSWGISAEEVAEDLAKISTPRIRVEINSPGGEVWEGIAIFNGLRAHPAHVTTRVDGIAASAASLIAQAGDTREIFDTAQLMIHEAWGMAIGPAQEMRDLADVLESFNDMISSVYAMRSDRAAEHFREMIRKDTYLSAEQAIDLGLADVILSPPTQDVEASASLADASTAAELEAVLAEMDEAVGRTILAVAGVDATQTPSAGEREEPAGEASAPSGIAVEDATRLLDALTINDREDIP